MRNLRFMEVYRFAKIYVFYGRKLQIFMTSDLRRGCENDKFDGNLLKAVNRKKLRTLEMKDGFKQQDLLLHKHIVHF